MLVPDLPLLVFLMVVWALLCGLLIEPAALRIRRLLGRSKPAAAGGAGPGEDPSGAGLTQRDEPRRRR